MAAAEERTGVLVLRAWIERATPAQVKVRLTSTINVSKEGSVTEVTMGVDRTVERVRAWLVEFGGLDARS